MPGARLYDLWLYRPSGVESGSGDRRAGGGPTFDGPRLTTETTPVASAFNTAANAPDGMRVELLRGTPEPEELVCRCARGDYSNQWVGSDRPFEAVMDSVEGETIDEKKETLLEHLFRSGHFGPFEHPTATFAVEGVSRSCMAQLTRHRHASFDVQSLRYTEVTGDPRELFCFPPSLSDQEIVSREGVSEVSLSADEREALAEELYESSIEAYERLIDAGVPKEDARMVLPLGTMVNLTFTMNARSLMHLLDMRLKGDAQWEVRELSNGVLDECKEWMPRTFERYEDNHPNKLTP
jgi:thymidylate synthase (FAD)